MASLAKYFIENETIGAYEQVLENARIIDVHTHIGRDMDGQALSSPELLRHMKANGIEKAIIFPFNDREAGKDYSSPNEKILNVYKKNPDKYVPFFRLDPNKSWQKEFDKRAGQGFAGLKLHPRSQKFKMSSDSVMKICEKVEKAGLILLMHAGFGLDYVADDLNRIARTFPTLKFLIGHGGFPELERVMRMLKDRANVMFDVSTMRIFDLVELLKNVSYRKIVFGSDIPLYDQTLALQMLVDSAIMAKQKPDHIRRILGGNIERWLK